MPVATAPIVRPSRVEDRARGGEHLAQPEPGSVDRQLDVADDLALERAEQRHVGRGERRAAVGVVSPKYAGQSSGPGAGRRCLAESCSRPSASQTTSWSESCSSTPARKPRLGLDLAAQRLGGGDVADDDHAADDCAARVA